MTTKPFRYISVEMITLTPKHNLQTPAKPVLSIIARAKQPTVRREGGITQIPYCCLSICFITCCGKMRRSFLPQWANCCRQVLLSNIVFNTEPEPCTWSTPVSTAPFSLILSMCSGWTGACFRNTQYNERVQQLNKNVTVNVYTEHKRPNVACFGWF